MHNLFKFNFTRQTAVALIAGFMMIALSLLMLPFGSNSAFDTIISFILRDVLMIFGLGVVFVSLYTEKHDDARQSIGFTNRKIILSIILNLVFASCLAGIFLKDQIPQNILTLSN
nr:hypothetical protein [Treponema sp.]